MKVSNENSNWIKFPIIGSFVGIKEAFQASETLNHLSTIDKTTLIGSKVFKYEEAFQQAKSNLFRGCVAVVPILGGLILAIYDRFIKNGSEKTVPFPSVLEDHQIFGKVEKVDHVTRCANLRDDALLKEIFDTNNSRFDDVHKKVVTEALTELQQNLKKIPQTNDKQELKLLKKAWIKALSIDCDPLAKLKFTSENIQKLGFDLLEEAWIESIRNALLGNSRIEVTRDVPGVSDISMAACFSVLGKYPQLKSSPFPNEPVKNPKDIKTVEIKDTKDFATTLGCQGLANLMASDREDLYHFQLLNCEINPGRAKEIAQGLAHNTHVRCLEIYRNPLGDEGAIAICKSLHSSFHTSYGKNGVLLDLRNCGIGDNSIDEIINLIKQSPNRVQLNLSESDKFTQEGLARLKNTIESLNKNRSNKIKLWMEVKVI